MNDYYIYRLEQGLSPAEQRAADQRIGEMAKAMAGFRQSLGRSLGRGPRALKAILTAGRARSAKQEAGSATAVAGH